MLKFSITQVKTIQKSMKIQFIHWTNDINEITIHLIPYCFNRNLTEIFVDRF